MSCWAGAGGSPWNFLLAKSYQLLKEWSFIACPVGLGVLYGTFLMSSPTSYLKSGPFERLGFPMGPFFWSSLTSYLRIGYFVACPVGCLGLSIGPS